MPAGALALARPKKRADVVGEATGDVQQTLVAQGALKRDRGLDQVTGAIQLVPVVQVLPARGRFDSLVVAVEVTIRALRSGDQGDRPVGQALQAGILLVTQFPGDG